MQRALRQVAAQTSRRYAGGSHSAVEGSVGIIRPRHAATPLQSYQGRPTDESTLLHTRPRGFENQASILGYTVFTLLGTYWFCILFGIDDQNASPLTRISPEADGDDGGH